MPEYVSLKSGQLSLSKIEGDKLRVHPEVFARMQEALAFGDGNEDAKAHEALRLAGLTSEEITARTLRETEIVVDPTLHSNLPL